MSTSAHRIASFGFVGMLALTAGQIVPVQAAAPPPPPLAVTFVAPTPAERAVVPTDAVSVAFTYNRTPAETRRVRCRLVGPVPSAAACSTPTPTADDGSSSGVSYAGLASGKWTFIARVRLTDGSLVVARRHFSVAAPQTLFATHADYWENTSGRYLAVQAFTSEGGTAAGVYSGPDLVAQWQDAAGAVLGSGAMTPYVDQGVYVRHRTRFRLGSLGTGGMPDSVRVTASGETSTIPVRRWIGAGAPLPSGFQSGFNNRYLDPYDGRQQLDDLAQAYPGLVLTTNLPELTNGYQRRSQAIIGVSTGIGAVPSAVEQDGAVVITSRAYGQNGGNGLTAWLADSGRPNAPLTVVTISSGFEVFLATDASGATTSTAAQVVAALSADPSASSLVSASTFRGNAGAGIPLTAPAPSHLSDFLNAPGSVPRGPFQQRVYRIGADHSGAKVGVFVYCQESGREWVTPLVCSETAERLARNYGTDPETTALLDNLEIFIVPSANPDGALYSMYDSSAQSRNMTNYCPLADDPAARNSWGVAIARNFAIGSIFDGFAGASTTCTDDSFVGPSEFSEPDTRNLDWVLSTFANIRFAANVSTGGSLTWSPSSYTETGRIPLPLPRFGTQGFFRQVGQAIAGGVNDYRGTTIGADRADVGTDVQGSEAGNFTDNAYYVHDVFAFDVGTGVPVNTSTSSDATISTGVQPCFGGVGTGGGQGFCPPNGALVNEGFNESMEFAGAAYALFRAALDYSDDVTDPTVGVTTQPIPRTTSKQATFTADDATDVYYTTDGSAPTLASTVWASPVPGAPRQPLTIFQTTTLRWIAVDVKGNVAPAQSQVITIP